jgi:2-haloacid dehalogenase
MDHIVFDIGRVLLDYEPERAFVGLIPDASARRAFLVDICSPAWNLEQDRGRPWREAEDVLIAQHPRHAAIIPAFRANWHAMIGPPIDANVARLRRFIAQGRDVTLLTNFAADTFRESQQRWAFLTETRGATVSGELGIIKPDAAIYAHHARTFALTPARTLFIDDNLANVEAAHACGWHAVHYTDDPALVHALAEFGLA